MELAWLAFLAFSFWLLLPSQGALPCSVCTNMSLLLSEHCGLEGRRLGQQA